jgi:hypothetical protein
MKSPGRNKVQGLEVQAVNDLLKPVEHPQGHKIGIRYALEGGNDAREPEGHKKGLND